MNDGKDHRLEGFVKSLHTLPAEERSVYQRIAGYNLGRIRNQHFPNKLSAMAATLQENHFREALNPRDLERQLRRWMSSGLPLENIEPISRALKITPEDFLDTSGLSNYHSKPSRPPSISDMSPETFPDTSENNPETTEKASSSPILVNRRYYLIVSGILAFLCLVFSIWTLWGNEYFAPDSITISWPGIVDTNSEYVSGKLMHFNPETYQDLSVKLFVKPIDGDTKYWLNDPDYPPTVTEDGQWYQKCRFGDEDVRSMKKGLPLRFDLYAVVLKEGAELPLDSQRNFFESDSETGFLELIAPYVVAVSERFSLVRVEPSAPEIPLVLEVPPPVKITWGENVPMYLEIYHGGQVIKEGYYASGDTHNLSTSQIPYEIKMSRKKDFHQSNTWILVGQP